MKKNFGRNAVFWLIIGLVVLMVVNAVSNPAGQNQTKLVFSEFLTQVEQDQVEDVSIRESPEKGTMLEGHYKAEKGGRAFFVQAPSYPALIDTLREKGVKINALPATTDADTFWSIVLACLPIILIFGISFFFIRQMQSGGGRGGAMGFGKSRAKLLTEKTEKVTFADVAGVDEAKEELEEVVDFLKDPAKFQRLGGKIPKGCLLVGPPGTGKTLLARAIAGEAGVPFFTISGSDFVEMFVGVGASRVRDMFEQGKKNAPCIIFIDEIDAVGRHRGGRHGRRQ